MKFSTALLGCILGAAAFLMAVPGVARADARTAPATRTAPADAASPLASLPGTVEEEREYAQREVQSPEVQEFEGGAIVIGFIALVVIVLLLILLLN